MNDKNMHALQTNKPYYSSSIDRVLFLLLVFILLSNARLVLGVDLFPLPLKYTTGSNTHILSPNTFTFTTPNQNNVALNFAIHRYFNIIFPNSPHFLYVERGGIFTRDSKKGKSNSDKHVVHVDSLEINFFENEELHFGVDESYELSINSEGMKLTSKTVFGALRGLETFSQLVEYDGTSYYISNTPIFIQDAPRYKWRGLLIDTGRHFLSVNTIIHILNSMSFNKLNVLHFHMVDGDSFPFESKSLPNLSKGAYSKNAIYTHDDIKKIVEHARLLGIMVVPELDLPGHTSSWMIGYPNIVANCKNITTHLPLPWNAMSLDITKEETFEVIEALISEVSELFPSEYIHLGGDEVHQKCFEEVESIRVYMEENGYAKKVDGKWKYDTLKLWSEAQERIQKISKKFNKKTVLWEESFNHNFHLDSNTVVSVWLNQEKLKAVAQSGKKAIMNYGYYVDRLLPMCDNFELCPSNMNHWFSVEVWKDFYLNDPMKGIEISPFFEKLILGGEISAWGETIDGSNVDEKIWTRGVAVSERLWSDKSVVDLKDAERRISSFRCKMLKRGVLAGPLNVDFCDFDFDFLYTFELNNYRYQRALSTGNFQLNYSSPEYVHRKEKEEELTFWILFLVSLVVFLVFTNLLVLYLYMKSRTCTSLNGDRVDKAE